MKALVKNSELDPNNPAQVGVFRLQCGMEFIATAMHWYVGDAADQPSIPPHQSLVALSLYLATTAEVLHLLHELAQKGVLAPITRWHPEAAKAWEFLLSTEVIEFKNQQLKRVRDKTAFHVDPDPVRAFLGEESRESGEIVLMENSDQHLHGFSPAAATILGRWLMSQGLANSNSARLATTINSSLRHVISAVVMDLFPNIRAET